MTEIPQTEPSWDVQRIRAQLKRWQERLLDLSKANPLLGINRSRVSRLKVVEPAAGTVFRHLVIEGRALNMPRVVRVQRAPDGDDEAQAEYRIEPGDVVFEATPPELHRRLRRIYDNARTSVEERGVTTLHVSFGVLRWEDPALGASISPLWLVPCQLGSFGPSAPMKLTLADEESQVNPALELYLRERHRVALPSPPEDPNAEALGAFLEESQARVREHGWKVDAEVWLSTYSFESLALYKDLEALANTAASNPLVAALARACPQAEASESLREEALDAAPTPQVVPIPALSSDSSQLRALTLAAAGRHLVIHGPPGTGKSQTIASLIADALGRGRTVLFVSAKMAALDVVYRRLAQLGLDRFCLEAHSTKAGKARIIDELRRTLAAAEADVAAGPEDRLEEFLKVREQLNAYVRALHQPRAPLGLTPYEAIGRAQRFRNEPDLLGQLPWADILAATRADLDDALDALRDLKAQAEVFDARATHPWRGLEVDPGRAVMLDQIQSDLRRIETVARALRETLSRLAPLLGPVTNLGWEGVRRLARALAELARVTGLPAGWSIRPPDELLAAAARLDEAAARVQEEAAASVEHDAMWRSAPADVAVLLEPAEVSFRSPLRRVQPAYWRWRRRVREQLRPGASAGFATLCRALATARRLVELRAWLEHHAEFLAGEVGAGAIRDAPRLREAATASRAAAMLRDALAAEGLRVPEMPASLSDELRAAAREVVALLDRGDVRDALDRIDLAWPRGFVDGTTAPTAPLATLLARCQELLSAPERAHSWIVLQHTLHRCRALGLGDFIDSLGSVSAARAPAAFERRFYAVWADAALQTTPELALFTGARRQEQIARFRELDEQLRAASLERIKAVASEPARRVATAAGGLGTSSQVGVLRKELQKQKRFKPLRTLFAEIPDVLKALKPCMLMSPLSVSTFLAPDKVTFDLVVFDEASQIPTPEGIPAILRGRQVVVAGDSKQLPPTSFFAASFIFDEDAEATEDLEPLESLLDDCVAIVPVFEQTHLRWHYRSRDERLIAFSNHYFYGENPLITFPSVAPAREDSGVRLVYVPDGVWDRGGSRTNRPEARRVVELIVEHAERWPGRSLGVVAMNTAQREAIEELLDERFLQRPDLREKLRAHTDEPFFIKALENVQGDERDTIIISVGYGKTASGALSYNFGPLNQEGGWRRLNVLVTRARWQTILVTSLRARELDGVNPNNRGAVALRNFIDYVERGGTLPPETPCLTPAETNDFEDAVAEALRARGYQVDQQVGVGGYRIDLAIRDPRDPRRYLLGVECDGATYHSAKTARDRDLLREQVLRELGWRLHRVWSSDWFRDRERAIEAAVHAIHRALEGGDHPPAPPRSPIPPSGGPPEAAPRGQPPRNPRRYPAGSPYRKAQGAGRRELLLDPARSRDLRTQIVRVVAVEGPIHRELLTERLNEINGVDRVGANVAANIERALQRALRRGELERVDQDFLTRPGQRLTTFRTPGDGVERPVAWIPLREIQLAVLHVLEDQFGCQRSALPSAVARLFGFDRTPPGLTEAVQTAVDLLIEEARVEVSGPYVSLR